MSFYLKGRIKHGLTVPETKVYLNFLVELDSDHPVKGKTFKPCVPDTRKFGM